MDARAALMGFVEDALATLILGAGAGGDAAAEFLAACADYEAACLRRARAGRWWWAWEMLAGGGAARAARREVDGYLRGRIREVWAGWKRREEEDEEEERTSEREGGREGWREGACVRS